MYLQVTPSKEETRQGYEGSKEEFLRHRAEKAQEIEREADEVDTEVRVHEVNRIVTEILAKVVGHLRTSTQMKIILTMLRRMTMTLLTTRLLLPPSPTRTSPSPRT